MYIGYIEDRKSMGYDVLLDTSCGIKLVSITNSTLLLIRNLPSNGNYTTKRIILVIALVSGVWFSNLESAEAIGLSMPPAPVVRVYPSYEHPSEVKIAPTVNPRLDKIYFMPNKKIIPLIYINGHYSYINEQLLKKLRAGDLSANLTIIAIGVVIYVICQLSGVDAFGILEQFGKLNAPITNLGFGPTVASTEIALVPTQAQEFNDMSLKFNEPKPNFVMTQNDALKLIEETYPGQLEITGNERISDWQAAKKIYHASDFGVNPEDYGMTKESFCYS